MLNHAPADHGATADADASGGCVCSSSLDASETNAQPLRLQTAAQLRIHHRHQGLRWRIVEALEQSGRADHARRAVRLSNCCMAPAVWERSDGSAGLVLGRCRDRLCPYCQRCRSREIVERISSRIRAMNSPRFITLTLKNVDIDLAGAIDRLMNGWRELRRTKLWKGHVTGGVYTLEIKRGANSGQWHPHLHIIADGSFLLQSSLSDAWLKATGDSSIVDIRKVNDAEKAAKYVAKYISKLDHLESLDDDAVVEFADAVHRRRMIHSFGTLHAVAVDEEAEAEHVSTDQHLIATPIVRDLARAAFPPAQRMLEIAGHLGGMWADAFGVDAVMLPESHPDARAALQRELVTCARECERRLWSRHHAPPPQPDPPPPDPGPMLPW